VLAVCTAIAGDPDLLLGYTGTGTALYDGMWAFAQAYADQTERDYARFTEAIAEGRLKAVEVF